MGKYELLGHLGLGANAEVWKAQGCDHTLVALKILRQRKHSTEPFKRFVAEVELLRSLGHRPGLLPILDSFLPISRRSPDYAWLAMPIATPITKALGDPPDLIAVAGAIAAVAETLALLAEQGISHRDIKPSNLYRYKNEWAIGDFGLADYPKKEAITAEGRKLGPLYFIAPEMLTDPKDADGSFADVYSLAKTLWVLATGQNYPPQGEHRVENAQLRIGAFVSEPRSLYLDRLVENATQYQPNLRPTMAELAGELRAWLSQGIPRTEAGDLSDLIARISLAAQPGQRADLLRHERIRMAEMVLNGLEKRLKPLARKIRDTGRSLGKVERGWFFPWVIHGSQYARRLRETTAVQTKAKESRNPEGDVVWQGASTIQASSPSETRYPFTMRCGFTAVLFRDGWIELGAGYFFHAIVLPPGWPEFSKGQSVLSRIGSVQQERSIQSLENWLTNNLEPALGYFADLLEVSLRDELRGQEL